MRKKKAASEFNSEKELQAYVVKNIAGVLRAITGKEAKSTKTEYPIGWSGQRRYSYARADILCEATDGEWYLFELKMPGLYCEVAHGVTQLLCYQMTLEHIEHVQANLILLSTEIDQLALNLIQRNNLNVQYAVVKDGQVQIAKLI